MPFLPRRLAPRLILGTTVLVVLGFALSVALSTTEMQEQLIEERVTAADQLARSITSATWHAMRAGRKEDAYEVMDAIGQKHGVERIRILDRTGRVTFETSPGPERQVDLDSPACHACHATDPPSVDVGPAERSRFWRGRDGHRLLGIVTPILNEPGCTTADCHAHAADVRVLGLLDVALDVNDVDDELTTMRWKAVLFALVKATVIAAFIAFFLQRFVVRPIRRLRESARAIANLQLDEPVAVDSSTELGELAASFDDMRKHLWAARARSMRFTEELEEMVEARTRELKATQERLVRTNRLASMGQLAASVAHEVNNPISAVLNLSIYLQRILKDDGIPPERLEAFRRHLGQIADETARAGRIVSDLLAFSRQSSPRTSAADLGEIVDRAMDLVRHRGALENVELVVENGRDLPSVICDASQIQQVVVNLLLNALEALGGSGRVVVRTYLESDTHMAVLEVEDDGPGIAEENLGRIFDPFFSTKQDGKGVGLGLAVVYGIVEAHRGRLDVHSREGDGATFTVRLPLDPEPAATEATRSASPEESKA